MRSLSASTTSTRATLGLSCKSRTAGSTRRSRAQPCHPSHRAKQTPQSAVALLRARRLFPDRAHGPPLSAPRNGLACTPQTTSPRSLAPQQSPTPRPSPRPPLPRWQTPSRPTNPCKSFSSWRASPRCTSVPNKVAGETCCITAPRSQGNRRTIEVRESHTDLQIGRT